MSNYCIRVTEHAIQRRTTKWIGHTLHRNFFQDILLMGSQKWWEGKEWGVSDDLKEKRIDWNLTEGLDRISWIIRFGRGMDLSPEGLRKEWIYVLRVSKRSDDTFTVKIVTWDTSGDGTLRYLTFRKTAEYVICISTSDNEFGRYCFSARIKKPWKFILQFIQEVTKCDWLAVLWESIPQPFKDEAYLFYIRTQCVPRCKHSPLRL
jgi:hypothetical protein